MIDKQCIETVRRKHAVLAKSRRELQAIAAEILSISKRSIFSVQRGDLKKAKEGIGSAVKLIKKGKTLTNKRHRLENEGMWRAALEEYGESVLYYDVMVGKTISCIPEVTDDDSDIYIGALSDLTGELTRSAVLAATERDVKEVKRLQSNVQAAVEYLLLLDLTGQLRQKFDQAKQNLRKIEEIAFNLSIHTGQ